MWHKRHHRPILCLEQTSLINPSPHGVRMDPGPAAPGSPKQSILRVPEITPIGPAAVAHRGHAGPPDVEVEWLSPARRALSWRDRKAAAAPNSTRPAGALWPRCPGVRSLGDSEACSSGEGPVGLGMTGSADPRPGSPCRSPRPPRPASEHRAACVSS